MLSDRVNRVQRWLWNDFRGQNHLKAIWKGHRNDIRRVITDLVRSGMSRGGIRARVRSYLFNEQGRWIVEDEEPMFWQFMRDRQQDDYFSLHDNGYGFMY